MDLDSPRQIQKVLVLLQMSNLVKDRKWLLKSYPQSMVAREMITCLVTKLKISRAEGRQLGLKLVELGFIEHVASGKIPFADEYLFFRFTGAAPALPADSANSSFSLDKSQSLSELSVEAPSTPRDLGSFTLLLKGAGLVEDRKFVGKKYPQCMVARQIVDWIIVTKSLSRPEAVKLGNALVDERYIEHVINEKVRFADAYLFFRFVDRNKLTHMSSGNRRGSVYNESMDATSEESGESSGSSSEVDTLVRRNVHQFGRRQTLVDWKCESAQFNDDDFVEHPRVVLLSDSLLVVHDGVVFKKVPLADIHGVSEFQQGQSLLIVCGSSGSLLGLNGTTQDNCRELLVAMASSSAKLKQVIRSWFLNRLLKSDFGLVDSLFLTLVPYEDAKEVTALVRLLDFNGSTAEAIGRLVAGEVERTTHSETLFRENSLASTCITEVMHQSCGAFVENTVFKYFDEHLKSNPLDAGAELTNDVVLADAQWLLDRVILSIGLLPSSLKSICEVLSREVSLKFPNHESDALAAFIFLRCICVGMVMPKTWGYGGAELSPAEKQRAKRVSKVLQLASTNALPGEKEDTAFAIDLIRRNYHKLVLFFQQCSVKCTFRAGFKMSPQSIAHMVFESEVSLDEAVAKEAKKSVDLLFRKHGGYRYPNAHADIRRILKRAKQPKPSVEMVDL